MKKLIKINEQLWIVFSQIVNYICCRSLNIAILSLFTPALLLGQMVVDTITNPGFVPSYMAVYETGNKLFVSDTESEHLLIYDCTTLNLIGELNLGYPGMMVVHESTGKLYLNINIDWGGKIAVIDAQKNELVRYIDGVNGTLRIDESLGKVYVLERIYSDINLQVIDIATDSVSTVQLSGRYIYSSIKVNPVTHEVFIGYRAVGDEKLDIVDGTTMTRTTVAAPNCRDLAGNWIENKVYLIPGPLNRYWVYDRDTGSTKDITSCYNDATEIFFNPADNKIYTDSEVDNSTIIIDGVTDSCAEIPMYGATTELAFRHASNHVYFVGLYGVIVMDGSTQLVEQFPNIWLDPDDDWNIVINQSTGRIFVSYYQSDPTGI